MDSILERRVNARCALLGIRLSDIAKLSGCSETSVHKWIRVELTTKGRTVFRDVLGVSDDWLDSESFADVHEGLE